MILKKNSLLIILISWGTLCVGQGKVSKSKSIVIKSKKNSQPKLIFTNKDDNVHCSLQDKAGNIWYGTMRNGLYKYDGKSFSNYSTTNGLIDNTINHLMEAKDGKIWISTNSGATYYDGKLFKKLEIVLPNSEPSKRKDVFSIMQDKAGKLWFATVNGVYIYDGKIFSYFKVYENNTDCYFKIEYILEDKSGAYWFGTRCNEGVFRFDGKTITHLKPYENDWAWPVLQDKKGNIWFSSWKGVYQYDGQSFKKYTKNDGLSGDMVARIMEDKKGNLWFGGDGLSKYDGKIFTNILNTDSVQSYTLDKNEIVTNKSVWSILEDKKGKIWIGTSGTGLYRYDGNKFENYSAQK
jgi:ligand-binding sensor domain-containing protein